MRQPFVKGLRAACLIAGCASFVTSLPDSASPKQRVHTSIFQRDSTCPSSQQTSCRAVDSKLPSDFCCASSSQCISLDDSSTALCCPSGADCSIIKPINCDVSLQDPTKRSASQVLTTKLSSELQKCGTACCPFGYTCGGEVCSLIKGTSSFAPGFNSTHSAPATTTQSTSASTPSGIDSSSPQPAAQCNKFPGAAVAVGFFSGVLAGALLMLLAVICLGRRSNLSRSDSRTSSFYKPHGTIRSREGAIIGVSEPIPMTDQPPRTDFLRRTTSKARSLFSSRSRSSFLPMGSNWKMPTPPENNNIPAVPGGRTYPRTPPRPDGEPYRTASTESITIYSPQNRQLSKDITPMSAAAPEPRAAPPLPTIGSPFKTPPSKEPLYHEALASNTQGETLTPARYNDGKRRQRADRDASRPTTTFTTMLHDIGFPDPIGRPSVPTVPRDYDTQRGRGR